LSEASAVLAQGVLLYPQEFEFALLLARVQQAQGKGALALESLELIPDEHSLARQKWLAQTDLAQKQGQFALAERAYRQLLQQEPRQGRWWMGLAYALDSQQQYPKARQAYRSALTHAGLSPQAIAFIEQRLTQLGDSQ
ncbi:MAG: tetratricopeptide repeat protein, partial [Shewanella sp.]